MAVATVTEGRRSPALYAAPSPSGRAAGKSQTASTCAQRPATSAATSAGARASGRRALSVANLSRRTRAPARAPNDPTRLSRMISRRRSGVRPPNRPSTVSIKPSRCRAPVSRAEATSSRALATGTGKARRRTWSRPARRSPRAAPTSGKRARARPSSRGPAGTETGRGTVVRNCTASTTGASSSGQRDVRATPIVVGVAPGPAPRRGAAGGRPGPARPPGLTCRGQGATGAPPGRRPGPG